MSSERLASASALAGFAAHARRAPGDAGDERAQEHEPGEPQLDEHLQLERVRLLHVLGGGAPFEVVARVVAGADADQRVRLEDVPGDAPVVVAVAGAGEQPRARNGGRRGRVFPRFAQVDEGVVLLLRLAFDDAMRCDRHRERGDERDEHDVRAWVLRDCESSARHAISVAAASAAPACAPRRVSATARKGHTPIANRQPSPLMYPSGAFSRPFRNSDAGSPPSSRASTEMATAPMPTETAPISTAARRSWLTSTSSSSSSEP